MPWKDDKASLDNFVNLEKKKGKLALLKNTGDRNAWDLTALFFVLLHSNSIGQKLKNLPTVLPYHTAIDQLRQSRNAMSHVSPSTYTSDKDFQQTYQVIEKSLHDLGFPDAHKDMTDVLLQYNALHMLQQNVDVCCSGTDLKCRLLGLELHQKKYPTFPQFLVILRYVGSFALIIVLLLLMKSLLHDLMIPNQEKPRPEYTSEGYGDAQLNTVNPANFYFPKPLQPHFFTGRETDIRQIVNYILEENIHLVQIVGPAAIGKTALSMRVGEYLRDKHGYVAAFTSLLKVKSTSSAFKAIMSSIGCQDLDKNDIPNMHVPEKTLFILDDVDFATDSHLSEFQELIYTFISFHKVTVLTTTQREWGKVNLDSVMYELGPLISNDSIHFLSTIYPVITKAHAKYIADITQGIPLLLEIIGQQLKAGLYSTHEFVRLTNKTEHVDPTNFHSFFHLLEIPVLKIDTHLQKAFVNFKYIPYHDRSGPDNYFAIAKLGLLKLNTTISKEVKFEMHPVLIEFTEYFCEIHPELMQWSELLLIGDFAVYGKLLTLISLKPMSLYIIVFYTAITLVFVENLFVNQGFPVAGLLWYLAITIFYHSLYLTFSLFTCGDKLFSSIEKILLRYQFPFVTSILTVVLIFKYSTAHKNTFTRGVLILSIVSIYFNVLHVGYYLVTGDDIILITLRDKTMIYKTFPLPFFATLSVSFTLFYYPLTWKRKMSFTDVLTMAVFVQILLPTSYYMAYLSYAIHKRDVDSVVQVLSYPHLNTKSLHFVSCITAAAKTILVYVNTNRFDTDEFVYYSIFLFCYHILQLLCVIFTGGYMLFIQIQNILLGYPSILIVWVLATYAFPKHQISFYQQWLVYQTPVLFCFYLLQDAYNFATGNDIILSDLGTTLAYKIFPSALICIIFIICTVAFLVRLLVYKTKDVRNKILPLLYSTIVLPMVILTVSYYLAMSSHTFYTAYLNSFSSEVWT